MSPMADVRESAPASGLDRRRFLARLSGLGVAAAAFPEVLWSLAQEQGALTAEVIAQAEKVAGVSFSAAHREMMLKGMNELEKDFAKLRELPLTNDVAPAIHFSPKIAAAASPSLLRSFTISDGLAADLPDDIEELAFWPATRLSHLVRSRKVSSTRLTRMYLDRLKRFDPLLHCVVTLTEERALDQARRADEEIASGRYRGPLHGLPWGVKDLFAVKGYPTTWGAAPYEEQMIDEDATAVRRLDDAGAVLVAKLTCGALAMGDVWFGGKTRNPWNPEEGSSGSSAGSASAVAAGLVAFALGTETLGSIVSPCTRCGATGLRPTFGRVSRHGAMALSWTMDKVGPIARSVEDCALVFNAIHGADGMDGDAVSVPFTWDPAIDIKRLRVGYVKRLFEIPAEEDPDAEARKEDREWPLFDRDVLNTLRSLGVVLEPLELPSLPADSMALLLTCEAAAAFDDLTRSGRDSLLTGQGDDDWPNLFRQAQLIPAVEYIQANRARTLLMREMAALFDKVDVYLCPSFGGSNLTLTNLTGHPAVVVPDGFRKNGTPTSITFQGGLYKEAETLALAKAYQDATGFHLRRPTMRTSEGG
jgi:Asp-tRNA(Asn)/Glu-tRNA(Gln) amidotransferase A subunit family amidase